MGETNYDRYFSTPGRAAETLSTEGMLQQLYVKWLVKILKEIVGSEGESEHDASLIDWLNSEVVE